ncbi:uncharacterized protein [Prorops nasuta]|uniref:uncharacterized protein n=1 Tax=Prorops nasuta TaxID=863751 RepID=UPI0034CD7B67
MNNLKTTRIVKEDGFCYYVNVKKMNKAGHEVVYLRCKRRECKGSAKLIQNLFYPGCNHNHEMEREYLKDALFREDLLNTVKDSPISTRDAYDYKSKGHVEAASRISYKYVKRTLIRKKVQICPFKPKSLKDIALMKNNEMWQVALSFSFGNIEHKITVDVIEVNSETQVILYDCELIKMFPNIKSFSMDATYYSMPKLSDSYQLLTLMGVVNNKVLPCVWVLMAGKSEAQYIGVLQFLKQSVLQNLEINHMKMDFELRLQNAVKIVFPSCKLTGCYFHYVMLESRLES